MTSRPETRARAGDAAREARPPLDAGERLRRLLAILAHLARVGQASIADLAERFDVDERTLVGELELAACCGLPPYTPDQLLELVVDDETVVAHGLDALRRPPRLTPDEGFAVAAAARAMLAVPGVDPDGPLAHALAKLERVLGEDRLQVELDAPEHLAAVRRALVRRDVVEIDYLGSKRGDETTRTVEPHAVLALEGRFYLDAYCHLADDWRRFQLDRIAAARPTGLQFERRTVPAELTGARAFAGGPSARVALVALPAGHQPLVDRLAAGPVETRPDGRLAVPVRVGDAHWLGRLLLRLGPDAEVLHPPELARVASDVAARALLRYQKPGAR
ncbi:MAG TPA: WYL domain-containing protein [Acidimicrobiales bacterium]|nr:WYL domain-containing protein [Acidimicrobiales bacterium]